MLQWRTRRKRSRRLIACRQQYVDDSVAVRILFGVVLELGEVAFSVLREDQLTKIVVNEEFNDLLTRIAFNGSLI